MTFVVDLCIVAFFVLVVFRSSRRGFVACILSILVWIAATLIATTFNVPVANAVYDTFLAGTVTQKVDEYVEQNIPDTSDTKETVDMALSMLDEVPQVLVRAAQSVGVDTDTLTDTMGEFDPQLPDISHEIESRVVKPVVLSALKAICFLALLFLSSSVLKLLTSLIEKFAHLPVLKQINRLLGAVLGVFKGAVLIYVFCFVLSILADLSGETAFARAVDESGIIAAVCDGSAFSQNLLL